MNWIEALKVWNTGRDKYSIPKKGTAEYDEVRNLMRGEVVDGQGFLDEISVLPPDFKKWLTDKRDVNVNAIHICRVPVEKTFTDLFNIITKNKLEAKLKQLKYDRLYHIFMIYHLMDGTFWLIDRQDRLNVFPYDPKVGIVSTREKQWKGKMKCMKNIYVGNKTVHEMFTNHKKSIGGWNKMKWYDVQNNNCQHFILNHLKANKLDTVESRRFILQKINEILNDYPLTSRLVNKALALNIVLSNVLQG